MRKQRERYVDKKYVKNEKKNWGKGTIVFDKWEDYEKVIEEFDGQLISPGGAAQKLGVSRSYIHQLEQQGKIRCYRIWDEHIHWESYPLWMRVFAPKKEIYVFIPIIDIEKIKLERIEKAEKKLRELKGK